MNEGSIFAVHGLDTSSERTWVAYEKQGDAGSRSVDWLRDEDMLPHFVRQARIFTYDWNAATFSNASGQYFHSHAETFLDQLEKHRRVSCGTQSVFLIA